MKNLRENNINKKVAAENGGKAYSGSANINGIGVDIIEVSRIKNAIKKHPGFLRRIYTECEISYCTGKNNKPAGYICLAQRFAAKEAVAKAIGIGFGKHFSFNEISVENDCNGKPFVVLYGRAKKFCKANFINSFYVSLSATRGNAVAFAIAFS